MNINLQQMESDFSSGQEEFSKEQLVSQRKYKKHNKNDDLWVEGIWTQDQKFRYVAYIIYNKDFLHSKLQRRKNKIFKQMSNFVGTRTPTQCRSQNQKMFRRYKTIHKIACEFKKEYGVERFQDNYEACMNLNEIKFSIEGTQVKLESLSFETRQTRKKETTDAGIQTQGQFTVIMSHDQHELWKSFKQTGATDLNKQLLYNYLYYQHCL